MEQFLQMFFPLLRLVGDNPPRLKRKHESADQISVVVERLRGSDRTVHPVAFRKRIYLLRWKIGGKERSLCGFFRTAHPDMTFWQFNAQIRAEMIPIVQLRKCLCIEKGCPLLQNINVRAPCRYSILIFGDTHSTEDLSPKTLHRLRIRAIWKHLACPCCCRYRDNTPCILIAHQTRTVVHECFARRLARLRETLRIDVRIEVGIRCRNRDECRPLCRMLIIEHLAPCGELTKTLRICLLKANVGELLIIPVDSDIIGTDIVCLRCECVYEVRTRNRCMDDKRLILLEVDANTNHKSCVFFQ